MRHSRRLASMQYVDPMVSVLQHEFDRIERLAQEDYPDTEPMVWTGNIVVQDDLVFFETDEPRGWMADGGPQSPRAPYPRVVWTDDLDDLMESAYPTRRGGHGHVAGG